MKLRNKKTGEIADIIYVYEGFICVDVWQGKSGTYATLAELNAEWEDYKPAEPLIKDKKIRKAVRAWAEAVGEEETFIVSYNIEYHDCCIYTGDLSNTAMIDFGTDLSLKEGSYTIAELCGEED